MQSNWLVDGTDDCELAGQRVQQPRITFLSLSRDKYNWLRTMLQVLHIWFPIGFISVWPKTHSWLSQVKCSPFAHCPLVCARIICHLTCKRELTRGGGLQRYVKSTIHKWPEWLWNSEFTRVWPCKETPTQSWKHPKETETSSVAHGTAPRLTF